MNKWDYLFAQTSAAAKQTQTHRDADIGIHARAVRPL